MALQAAHQEKASNDREESDQPKKTNGLWAKIPVALSKERRWEEGFWPPGQSRRQPTKLKPMNERIWHGLGHTLSRKLS